MVQPLVLVLVCAAGLLAATALAVAGESPPLKVCLVSGCGEYKSDESLTAFKAFLEARRNVACTQVSGNDKGEGLPGIEAVNSCDVMLLFTRRITLPEDQLKIVRAYCRAGRPVVGVRTASHAFQNWLAFDKEVLGGNYQGHYGAGPKAEVAFEEKAKDHPVLAGVRPFASAYSLYMNTGLAADVTLLATATSAGKTEPVAWTRMHNGGRVFYTSLGGPDDFRDENFRRMLTNALFWAAKRTVEDK